MYCKVLFSFVSVHVLSGGHGFSEQVARYPSPMPECCAAPRSIKTGYLFNLTLRIAPWKDGRKAVGLGISLLSLRDDARPESLVLIPPRKSFFGDKSGGRAAVIVREQSPTNNLSLKVPLACRGVEESCRCCHPRIGPWK